MTVRLSVMFRASAGRDKRDIPSQLLDGYEEEKTFVQHASTFPYYHTTCNCPYQNFTKQIDMGFRVPSPMVKLPLSASHIQVLPRMSYSVLHEARVSQKLPCKPEIVQTRKMDPSIPCRRPFISWPALAAVNCRDDQDD